jgi:hypothetical protein
MVAAARASFLPQDTPLTRLWLVLWILLPLWPSLAPAGTEALLRAAGSFQDEAWGGGPGAPGRTTATELLRMVEAGSAERTSWTAPPAPPPARAGLRAAPPARVAGAGRGHDVVSPHAERLPYHANAPPLG